MGSCCCTRKPEKDEKLIQHYIVDVFLLFDNFVVTFIVPFRNWENWATKPVGCAVTKPLPRTPLSIKGTRSFVITPFLLKIYPWSLKLTWKWRMFWTPGLRAKTTQWLWTSATLCLTDQSKVPFIVSREMTQSPSISDHREPQTQTKKILQCGQLEWEKEKGRQKFQMARNTQKTKRKERPMRERREFWRKFRRKSKEKKKKAKTIQVMEGQMEILSF